MDLLESVTGGDIFDESAVEATKQFQSEVGVDAIGAVTAETAAAAEAMGFHFVDPTLDEPAVLPSNSLEYYLIQKYGAGKTTNEYKDVSKLYSWADVRNDGRVLRRRL